MAHLTTLVNKITDGYPSMKATVDQFSLELLEY